MSTRSKSETSIKASTNMPSVVCPADAAHAERHANTVSDRASLCLSRPRGHRPLVNTGALDHGGVPRPPDRGALRPGALGTVARLCDRRTRVVAISAVQFWSGFRTDLDALRTALKGHDALLVVDAIQAAGAMHLDLSSAPVDFLCAGAQKWLLGPIGVGFAYVGPRMLERLTLVTIGTDSVVRGEEYFEYDLTLKPDARRFEEAAPNYPGILGMGAAINLLLRAGPPAVEEAVLNLADRLRDELPSRGYELVLKPTLPSERSGIVSFRHPRMVPAELHTRLREAGVIISLRGDFLRASPHYYNSDEDLDRLLEALPQ